MKTTNLFIETNWTSTYKNSDQLWVNDSLNWDKTFELTTFDWTFISFIFNSSFLNQYQLIDQITKISYLDILLINSVIKSNNTQLLYDSYTNDLIIYLNIHSLSLTPLLQSDYQENLTNIVFLAPELSIFLNNYFSSVYLNNIINLTPVPVFDLFLNNFNFYFNNTLLYFFIFFFFLIFFIFFFFFFLYNFYYIFFFNKFKFELDYFYKFLLS